LIIGLLLLLGGRAVMYGGVGRVVIGGGRVTGGRVMTGTVGLGGIIDEEVISAGGRVGNVGLVVVVRTGGIGDIV
jgi:hypothetical protein